MNRVQTTVALTLVTFVMGFSVIGIWAVLTTPFLLSLPLYLIWVDSKKPFSEQWRYVNRSKK